MSVNPLRAIGDLGQSIWQDDLRREMIHSGELQRLIEEDGLRGITSNPEIFNKAIGGSRDYDDDIRALALQGKSAEEIYRHLTVKDVQMAADVLRPVYDHSGGRHGFVSLEVDPHLARDIPGTMAEARRLWQAVNRPNAMIKVPGTEQGLICLRQLVKEGLNINVTLLFGLPRYRMVAEAYIGGLEDRLEANHPLGHVSSVASFFLSRIDVRVDPILKKRMQENGEGAESARRAYGQTAIAGAKGAYRIYKEIFEGGRFKRLQLEGAQPQRVLWASTSTKEPEFSDIKYVEALIGPETINTMPRKTLDAYRDHGQPALRLTRGMDEADRVLNALAELDINIDQVSRDLEDEGIEKFNRPHDQLMEKLEEARRTALREPVDRQIIAAPAYDSAIRGRIATLEREEFGRRLGQRDARLWPHEQSGEQSVSRGLGWLTVAAAMQDRVNELTAFRQELLDGGLRHVVHMGMGGSSLAPLVFQRSFAVGSNGLSLNVLDTTDPIAVKGIEDRLPLEQTFFIVASKSGTTTEPLAFCDYFFDRLTSTAGDSAGAHFAAITDPGAPLADLARERRFRRVFLNFEDIGGRYSALSYFGLLPAALMGLNVSEMLVRAHRMMHACAADRPAEQSPGLILGAALGELAIQGRDKVTFIVPPALQSLGMWLEQLLAESTGKDGRGLLPVAGEPLAPPSFYRNDRVFVHFRLDHEADERVARSVDALSAAGQPVIAIHLRDRLDLAQEFFRWEVATAAAGAILGVNAFDQPNVRESKENTRRLLETVGDEEGLPDPEPSLVEGPFTIYLPSGTVESTLARTLVDFFRQTRQNDYIALLAYLTEEAATDALLDGLRLSLQQKFRTAVTAGYGPRYLHSTGQFHKGGTDNGLFILLTCDPAPDAGIPGKPYSFGTLRQAQAQGDLEALDRRGRRVVRIHLGRYVGVALAQLKTILEKSLAEYEQ